jgi:hypothetical protein
MNLQEAFQLLTLASARDGRTVDKEVAIVWADDLAHVNLTDAVEAARMHYRETTTWLMPGHVIANVKKIHESEARRARIQRQLNPAPEPEFSQEGLNAYWEEVRRLKELKTSKQPSGS